MQRVLVSDLGGVWHFTRTRLAHAWEDLSEEQLSWRPHPGAHSIAELLVHIAAAEHYWAARLTGRNPADTPWGERLDRAVREAFLIEGDFPFKPDELNGDLTRVLLSYTAAEIGPIIDHPSQQQLEMPLISPIGDEVSGREGLTRLAQHAGYHTGQIWVYRMHPGFP